MAPGSRNGEPIGSKHGGLLDARSQQVPDYFSGLSNKDKFLPIFA